MIPSTDHSATRHPGFHTFRSASRDLLLEVATGRIMYVEPSILQAIENAAITGNIQQAALMASLAGIRTTNEPETAPPKAVSVRSFSLAIAQKCNLGCTYCYAEQGTFGGRPDNMPPEIARSSVDRLFMDTQPDEPITIAFMGGEPFFNRQALYETTTYAAKKAEEEGRTVSFSITTNATLIRSEDVEFLQKYRFTVTVSVDGIGDTNDTLRPYISGKGSFTQVQEKLKLLFGIPNRNFRVLGRVTVTPQNLGLTETFQGLLDLGFDSVQFSPMLKSPSGKQEMSGKDFDSLLEQLISCGEIFRTGFMEKKLMPLQNVLSTLKRIHTYEREMYPCGAGGGYMGVSAEGELYACHRFVNDEAGHMGDLKTGVNPVKQAQWLQDRHLGAQSACTDCWARYLCSGSCHHEVIKRGRPACDYIRGWLHYCLGLYVDLYEADSTGLRLLLGDNQEIIAISEEQNGAGLQF